MNKDFKKVDAKLVGSDGNVFNLIAICQRALKNNGYYNEAKELAERVTNSHSYDEALQIMLEYVNPTSLYDDYDDYDDFDMGGF